MSAPAADAVATGRAGAGDGAAISVIMPVFDGAAMLAKSLPPLLALAAAGEVAEVIVVDDGSGDGSADVARGMGAHVVDSGDRVGPGGARNRGAAIAAGAILWFVDADVVVHADAARVLATALADPAVVAVFGTYDERPAARTFLSQYKNLAHRHQHVVAAGPVATFWAGCGAVRADAFREAGGFDAARYPRPSIEDVELGLRLAARGGAIVVEPRLQATHLKAWSLVALVRTDVMQRARPWTRLIRAHPAAATLNAGPVERARAALAWLLAAAAGAALAGVAPPWLPAALFLLAVAANRQLFGLFARVNGIAFAFAALAFHQLHYLYASAAFVFFWLVPAEGSSSRTMA